MDVMVEALNELLDLHRDAVNLGYGYEEATDVLAYTVAKWIKTGNDYDYLPLLFKDELKDRMTRDQINRGEYS